MAEEAAAAPLHDYSSHVHARQSLYSPGAFCEVSGQAAEGFGGAWYIGTVSLGGKRSLIDVICTEFVEEDGTPVVERVVKTRLRPLPPATAAEPRPLESYKPGDPVDVRSNDCWWEATVLSPEEAAAPPPPPPVAPPPYGAAYPDFRAPPFSAAAYAPTAPPPPVAPAYAPPPYGAAYPDFASPFAAFGVDPAVPFYPPAPLYAPAPVEPAAPAAAPLPLAPGLHVRVNLSREVMTFTVASEVRPGMSWGSRRGWRPRSKLDDAYRAAGSDTAVFDFAEGAAGGVDDDDEDGDDGAPARSSKRAKRSRVTMVNGFSVLRLNNYSLTGGEPSVFDRELGGVAEWDAPVERAPPQPKKRGRKAGAAAMRPHAPQSTEEAARQAHNKKIDIARATLVPRRAAFLESHLAVLEPFVTPAVVAQIRRFAAAAPKAAKAPARVAVKLPMQVNAQLRPHQVEGLKWLSHMFHTGVNAILADEMGLGKTLQTIALLAHLKFDRNTAGPHLVVCPLSVLSSWISELAKWCPALRVVRLHSSDEGERARLRREVVTDAGSFDVAVTTYDMVVSPAFGAALTSKLHWRCLVLDEGHKCKNETTQVSQALRRVAVNCQYTLLLTGTPLQNNLHELWALLSLLHPDVFTDATPFDGAFKLFGRAHAVDPAALHRAHLLLKPFCLRRTKGEVEVHLPPKVETRVMCPLSAAQTFWYRRLLLKDSPLLERAEQDAGVLAPAPGEDAAGAAPAADAVAAPAAPSVSSNEWRRLQNLVMQLRTCCNHPYAFPGAEPEEGPRSADELAEASGKLKVLDRLLVRLKAGGHRVVLFSQFTSMLDILSEFLRLRGYAFARLDGSTNRVQRTVDMLTFNRAGSPLFIFLLSTRAGGLGVNLQSADTCILYDSDWNPQVDAQAMARVHRIGQTKPVAVFRLVTAGTVEERMVQRAEKKLYLDTMVHHGGGDAAAPRAEGAEAGLSGQELLATLKFGADALFRTEAGAEPSEEELDALCDRTEGGDARRAALGERMNAAAAKSAANFEGDSAPLSTFMLQGEDFSAMRAAGRTTGDDSIARIAAEFAARGPRQRQSTTVTIDGFTVKRANLYTMEHGEPSVFAREAAPLEEGGEGAEHGKRRMERAGREYPHADLCQVCWADGTLYCCDLCPAAYHAECIGETEKALQRANPWVCPHHSCQECGRKAAAAGGLLFRCECCAGAFCEDHLPEDVVANGRIVGQCERFVRLGQTHPAQACFVHCSADCARFAEEGYGGTLAAAAAAAAALAAAGGVDEMTQAERNAAALRDYTSHGTPWHEPGDDALLLRTATGRDKALTAASFSDLKNYLAGVKGAKFRVKARGKWHTIEDLKIRLATPGLRDALTAAMYAEARDCLREGLQPERRTTTAAAPAWNVQSFNSAPRRERAANSDAPPPGTLLPEIKRERICWTAEEEKALRAAIAEHGDDWPSVHAHASGVLHAKRTRQDCKVKARLLAAKDAGLEEDEEEDEAEEDDAEAEDDAAEEAQDYDGEA